MDLWDWSLQATSDTEMKASSLEEEMGKIKIWTLIVYSTIFCNVCSEGPANLDFFLQ